MATAILSGKTQNLEKSKLILRALAVLILKNKKEDSLSRPKSGKQV